MRQKIIFTFLLAASAALVSTQAMAADGHPELTEQEKLIACADCHKTATPQLHEQWYNSLHGIGMVKCYQCHGTFENLVVSPDRSRCATCHMAALEKCPKDKECSACHSDHTFKAK